MVDRSPSADLDLVRWEITANQQIYLRKSFNVDGPVESAKLFATCDNQMTLWINGKEIGKSPDWPQPIHMDADKHLKQGKNTIAVAGKNAGGTAAFVLKLAINPGSKSASQVVLSDTSWKLSKSEPTDGWQNTEFDDSQWSDKLVASGKLGTSPWGIPGQGGSGNPGSVTPADELEVAEGFVVDLIYSVPKEEQGSWVVLDKGPNGSLIACDQGGQGLFSITIEETSDGPQANVQSMNIPNPDGNGTLSGAQGLLYAFDALWFHRNGGNLYRITDSNGDGKLDRSEALPSQRGGGEHGNHALILSQDGKSIYMDGGNHAPLHEIDRRRVQSWQEDHLLPRMWDARGHARGVLAPGGWVTQLDPTTLKQDLICIGFRNQYDIAMNRFGDIFTYDADMEWDLGTPWYRPTRICHVVSGGDFGWRSGSGKYPTYYEDSLPPVVEIGPGSPTGVASGIGAKFPAEYQDAIFALDWTFGTIYAIHLIPDGSSYTARSELFVAGVPLPVTDATVGSDGHLYFTVGGRGTQSGLYRVRYVGSQSTAPMQTAALPSDIVEARGTRAKLESFHGLKDDAAVDTAWPHLSSTDRFIRNAARVAIESQPVDSWAKRMFDESDPQAKITAAVALARMGDEKHQSPILESLLKLDLAELSVGQTLGLCRAYALTFIRMGRPDAELSQRVIAQLNPHLPNKHADVNTELVRVLTYLESPDVIAKAMKLIEERPAPQVPDWTELAQRNAGYGGTVRSVLENHPPSREIGFALMLRTLRKGWTLPQRRAYFEFLNTAAKASGGASYPGFMTNIREEALGNASDEHRAALADITGEDFNPVPDFEIRPIQGPGRKWTTGEALSKSGGGFKQADFESGRSLYFATGCGKCHRIGGLGGSIGPDLTSIRNKFDVGYVVEHIIEPSKVISDQYQSSNVLTVDGRSLTGLVSEEDGKLTVYPADANADPITLDVDDVDQVRPSPVSQMPVGLIDGLNPEELRDLLAYLMSGGNADDGKIYNKDKRN
ncbi:MAG: c-type cytochrome [Pirellulaceae bacterium]